MYIILSVNKTYKLLVYNSRYVDPITDYGIIKYSLTHQGWSQDWKFPRLMNCLDFLDHLDRMSSHCRQLNLQKASLSFHGIVLIASSLYSLVWNLIWLWILCQGAGFLCNWNMDWNPWCFSISLVLTAYLVQYFILCVYFFTILHCFTLFSTKLEYVPSFRYMLIWIITEKE